MKPLTNRFCSRRGFSLIEAMIVVAGTSAIVLGIVNFTKKSYPLIQQTQTRQKVMTDGRVVMDIISQRLRNGKAATLVFSAAPSGLPNSRIDFDLVTPLPTGATHYGIYMTGNKVYIEESGPGYTPPPRAIGSNVSSLFFSGDAQEPSVVTVNLLMETQTFAATRGTTATLTLNREVKMVEIP